MDLELARKELLGRPIEFGDPEQIAAVERIERAGKRPDAQKRRWVSLREVHRQEAFEALDAEVFPCPHCGRLPWLVTSRKCAGLLAKRYHLGFWGSWLIKFSKEWYLERGGYRLRMIAPEKTVDKPAGTP